LEYQTVSQQRRDFSFLHDRKYSLLVALDIQCFLAMTWIVPLSRNSDFSSGKWDRENYDDDNDDDVWYVLGKT